MDDIRRRSGKRSGKDTVKMHDMMHYFSGILAFGSSESFRCEAAENLHKPLKKAYRRTNRQATRKEQLLRKLSRQLTLPHLQDMVAASKSKSESQLPVASPPSSQADAAHTRNRVVGLAKSSAKSRHPWGATLRLFDEKVLQT